MDRCGRLLTIIEEHMLATGRDKRRVYGLLSVLGLGRSGVAGEAVGVSLLGLGGDAVEHHLEVIGARILRGRRPCAAARVFPTLYRCHCTYVYRSFSSTVTLLHLQRVR